jgi:hypothetical protein
MARVDQRLQAGSSHYHPEKANIVANALSHKAHCKYLPAVRWTGEESST